LSFGAFSERFSRYAGIGEAQWLLFDQLPL
jgi:hypothetical protein